jgi:hypothetical protein
MAHGREDLAGTQPVGGGGERQPHPIPGQGRVAARAHRR